MQWKLLRVSGIEDEPRLLLQPPAGVLPAPVRFLGGAAVREGDGITGFAHHHDHMTAQIIVVFHQVSGAKLVPAGVVHPPPGEIAEGCVGAQGGPSGTVSAAVVGPAAGGAEGRGPERAVGVPLPQGGQRRLDALLGDGGGGWGFAGVGLTALHLDRGAVPVDVEAHGLAHIPELDEIVAMDLICLHLDPLSVHIDGLGTEAGGETAGRLGGGPAQGHAREHAHGEGDNCSFFHSVWPPFCHVGTADATLPQQGAEVEYFRRTVRAEVLRLLHPTDAPAVGGLIFHAGVQRDAVFSGGGQAGGVGHIHLGHAADGVGPGAQHGGEGDDVAGFQGMDLAKIVPHTSVMSRNRHISQPNAGVFKMARALQQRCGTGALVHAHRQADGGDLQGAQAAVGVVQAAGHLGEGHGLPACGAAAAHRGKAVAVYADAGVCGRVIAGGIQRGPTVRAAHAAHLIDQPSVERAGGQVWGEVLAGARQVAGGSAEAGRDQGGVLGAVHVGVLPLVDGIVAGGPSEQIVVRAADAVFQSAGRGHAQGAQQDGGQDGAQFSSHRLPSFSKFFEGKRPADGQDEHHASDHQRGLDLCPVEGCGRLVRVSGGTGIISRWLLGRLRVLHAAEGGGVGHHLAVRFGHLPGVIGGDRVPGGVPAGGAAGVAGGGGVMGGDAALAVRALRAGPLHVRQGQGPALVRDGFGDQRHICFGQIRIGPGGGQGGGLAGVAVRGDLDAGVVQPEDAGVAVLRGELHLALQPLEDGVHLVRVAGQGQGAHCGEDTFHLIFSSFHLDLFHKCYVTSPPPFPGRPALLEILVPILPAGRDAGGHLQAPALVHRPQLFRGLPARAVVVQAQHHMVQVGVVLQVAVQGSGVQAAQGHGVGHRLPVEGAEAHQVYGGLKDQHPGDGGVAGDGEGHAFVAAQHVPLEAGAVLVVGAAFAGKFGLTIAIPAHEHGVVVLLVLVQQAGVEERPDDLGGDAPLAQVAEHTAVVPIGRGQGELRSLFLLGGSPGPPVLIGGPGLSIELQQVVHRLPEALPLKFLEEGDGVAARSVGIPLPGAAVFDHKAVHLPGRVVPPDPLHLIAQVLQQVRQVGIFGGLHLLVCEFPEVLLVCSLSRNAHLLWPKRKTGRESAPQLGAFSRAVQ